MGYNGLIIYDFHTLFLEEVMNISDHIHEMRTSYRMSLRRDREPKWPAVNAKLFTQIAILVLVVYVVQDK
jgi:hypothetical protein